MKLQDAEDRSAAAGEYVLGTLAADERAAFEAALAQDAALQAEVYAWQDRLLGLARGVAPAEPAPQAWARIEAGLGGPLRRAPAAAAAANDPLWQRLRRWQLVSGLAVAASLVLASLLVLRAPVPPADEVRYLAVLQAPDDKNAGWIVEASERGGVRLVPVGPSAAVPLGKSLQFWTKAEGAAGPTSLGLVRAGEVTEVPAARLPVIEAKQLFELTLEPEAGSPLDRPTGPILYLGRTVRL